MPSRMHDINLPNCSVSGLENASQMTSPATLNKGNQVAACCSSLAHDWPTFCKHTFAHQPLRAMQASAASCSVNDLHHCNLSILYTIALTAPCPFPLSPPLPLPHLSGTWHPCARVLGPFQMIGNPDTPMHLAVSELNGAVGHRCSHVAFHALSYVPA